MDWAPQRDAMALRIETVRKVPEILRPAKNSVNVEVVSLRNQDRPWKLLQITKTVIQTPKMEDRKGKPE
jgi:hypothetical protein